jgi:hypothetical protein
MVTARTALALALVLSASAAWADEPIRIIAKAHHAGTLIIQGKRIVCTSPDQTAIYLEFPLAPAVVETTVILRDITIVPGCKFGVFLVNAWGAIAENINIYGGYGDDTLANGVILQGQSHNVKLLNAAIYHATTCIYVTDVGEGTNIDGATCAGTTYGVYATSLFRGRPWLNIANSHFDCSLACIVAVNRAEVSISNTLIYRHLRMWPKDAPWQAMVFQGSEHVRLSNVFVNCKPNELPGATYPGKGYAIVSTLMPLAKSDVTIRNCD